MHRATACSAPDVDAFCATGTSPTRLAARSRRRAPARYEIVGPENAPLVVVLGGISASRHVTATPSDPSPGWWQAQVGDRGQAVDTRRLQVLSFDFIGGPGAAGNAPAVANPVTTADQADALARLLDALGARRIALLIGASYGGMVGLAFAARHGARLGRLLALGAAHRPHPMATALRSLQRRIVRLGLETGRAGEALAIARGVAMTTYRSAREFEARFEHGRGAGGRYPVETYLEARGAAFARDFCAHAFLRLSGSIDLHAVDPSSITVPATLVSFATDAVVPPWLVQELAGSLAGPVTLHRLPSAYGHDSFLTDVPAVAAVLREEIAQVIR